MRKIKYLILVICLSALLSEDESKTKKKIDFKDVKLPNINIPNIIPKNLNDNLARPITDHEIDKIKQASANYIPEPVSDNDIIIFETSIGTFEAKFFNDKAPNHCYNFKKLANSGFYDGTKFHRVIQNFMVQGGDILSRDGNKDNDGTGNPGWTIDAEFNKMKHLRGTLSMARSSDPNSAGSQFFICVSPQAHLDGQYTAFGQVTDKVRIIDHIVNSPTDSQQAIMSAESSIPDGEDANNWIGLKNPKNGKPIYFEVPKNTEKHLYTREMMAKLRSNNPFIPVIIKKVRVVKRDMN